MLWTVQVLGSGPDSFGSTPQSLTSGSAGARNDRPRPFGFSETQKGCYGRLLRACSRVRAAALT